MDHESLVQKVQGLTDLELGTLLCLVAGQHCIIQTEEDALNSLEEELQLIAANVFGLTSAVLRCSISTTLEDFSEGILIEKRSPVNPASPSLDRKFSNTTLSDKSSDNRKIASIILVRDLSLASHQVQIQALELQRTNRIFTHTAFFSAPKPFLMIALNSTSSTPLVNHLNDHIFISHYHDSQDGFANLEDSSEWIEDDRASLSSVVHRSAVKQSFKDPLISQNDIHFLSDLSRTASVSIEVKRYLQNMVTFLRMHRAVAGGISPRATKHFDLLVRCLAPLHDLDYVTPSLVALATPKIYRHRIVITTPENERSMQYGSDLMAVEALLEGMTPERVVEDVLAAVETPL